MCKSVLYKSKDEDFSLFASPPRTNFFPPRGGIALIEHSWFRVHGQD
jgi:hypothetical protein